MAKFRTKPFEIEAIQYRHNENLTELQVFTDSQFRIKHSRDDDYIIAEVFDKLHNTWVGVRDTDWIIKGMAGEFYPCNHKVFEAKYEADGKPSENAIVLYVLHNAVDPERVAAEVIKRLRMND